MSPELVGTVSLDYRSVPIDSESGVIQAGKFFSCRFAELKGVV